MYARCLHNTMPPLNVCGHQYRLAIAPPRDLITIWMYHLTIISTISVGFSQQHRAFIIIIPLTFSVLPTNQQDQAARPQDQQHWAVSIVNWLSLSFSVSHSRARTDLSILLISRRRLLGRLLSFDSSHHCWRWRVSESRTAGLRGARARRSDPTFNRV